MKRIELLKSTHYGKGLLFSLIIHGCLILLLLVSLEKTVRPQALHKPTGDIVQATVVDEKQVTAEVNRLESIEKQKQQEAQKKVQQLTELAKMKQQEEEKLAEIKLAKEKEKKQLEVLKKEQEKEKKRLAALEDKRQEEQDRAIAARRERENEEKKKAQKEALAKKKAEDEAKKLIENEKKQAALNAANDNEASEQAKWMSSEIEKYDAMMRHKINQCWVRPPGLQAGLFCELYARLLPDGSVIDPQVKKSSGNYAFDQAAISALQNASPLPVPTDPNLMDEFRQFNFKFSPPEET